MVEVILKDVRFRSRVRVPGRAGSTNTIAAKHVESLWLDGGCVWWSKDDRLYGAPISAVEDWEIDLSSMAPAEEDGAEEES